MSAHKAAMLLAIVLWTTVAQKINRPAFKASPWKQCPDYPDFECRNVTVPLEYEPSQSVSASATINNLERRLVKGDPKTHVWILQGGPMENPDILLLVLVPQISKALGNNFAIQVPSQRGSQHTDHIPDYAEYPTSLAAYLANQTLPIQSYSTSNIARDIVSSIKHEKRHDVKHMLYGSSYGTFLANRILQLEPALFSTVLLDGVLPPINTQDGKAFGVAQLQTPQTLSLDCARSAACLSWGVDRLTTFLADMEATGQASSCFTTFSSLSGAIGPPTQIFDNFAYSMDNSPQFPVPRQVFANQTYNITSLLPKVAAWYTGVRDDHDLLSIDNRVMLWAAVNHFAQCQNSSDSTSIQFVKQVLLPYVSYVTQLTASIAGNASSLSSTAHLMGDHINYGELNLPYWNSSQQQSLQNNSLVRRPQAVLQSTDSIWSSQRLFFTPTDIYWNRAATDVQAEVVMINGDLDPNTPLVDAQRAFQDIQVVSGHNKTFHTIPHGGHSIIPTAWSSCNPLILLAYLAEDQSARSRLQSCLMVEAAKVMDWELTDLKRSTGLDIWKGLERQI